MVLDFGSQSLFQNQGLQQDTGLLSDRWGQPGSKIKNIYFTDSSGTKYTVSSGKRLFISSMTVTDATPNLVQGLIKDGGSGGTTKTQVAFPSARTTASFTFATPLYFDTDVYYTDTAGFGAGAFTLTGWEEDKP